MESVPIITQLETHCYDFGQGLVRNQGISSLIWGIYEESRYQFFAALAQHRPCFTADPLAHGRGAGGCCHAGMGAEPCWVLMYIKKLSSAECSVCPSTAWPPLGPCQQSVSEQFSQHCSKCAGHSHRRATLIPHLKPCCTGNWKLLVWVRITAEWEWSCKLFCWEGYGEQTSRVGFWGIRVKIFFREYFHKLKGCLWIIG